MNFNDFEMIMKIMILMMIEDEDEKIQMIGRKKKIRVLQWIKF